MPFSESLDYTAEGSVEWLGIDSSVNGSRSSAADTFEYHPSEELRGDYVVVFYGGAPYGRDKRSRVSVELRDVRDGSHAWGLIVINRDVDCSHFECEPSMPETDREEVLRLTSVVYRLGGDYDLRVTAPGAWRIEFRKLRGPDETCSPFGSCEVPTPNG